jgi:hypothetical protein
MNNYFEMEIQKYWAPTSAMSQETFREHLEQCISSENYLWSEKFDGNFSRAVITPGRNALQTRGISKVTGTYGEIQDKVFFWDSVLNAFQNSETVLLGEIYLPGGIDKDVGSITRCLVDKARARQKERKLEWRIFDVLVLDGKNMINSPIEERISYIPAVVKRINNPLVKGVKYYEMNETFFDRLNTIFSRGGEGAVCYRKGVKYTPGKRSSAWTTIKVKQTIQSDIDCFITSAVPCERSYKGKELDTWEYWFNVKTGEKLFGEYYSEYRLGSSCLEPISKNYYYDWPSSVQVGVYDKEGKIIPLCKVAGLTEDFKTSLRDNFEEWYLCPITIGGMMVSEAKANEEGIGLSVRHPYIKSIRREDLDVKDCTLAKIKG